MKTPQPYGKMNQKRMDGTYELTPRQLEIVGLLTEGLSNKQIGQRLYLSEDTVKTQLKRAFIKLGAENRVEAAMTAVKLGLIPN